MSGIGSRLLLSGVAVGASTVANAVLNATSTIALGRIAGAQFENSDITAIGVQAGFNLFSTTGAISGGLLLFVLLLIWWAPLKALFKTPAPTDGAAR